MEEWGWVSMRHDEHASQPLGDSMHESLECHDANKPHAHSHADESGEASERGLMSKGTHEAKQADEDSKHADTNDVAFVLTSVNKCPNVASAPTYGGKSHPRPCTRPWRRRVRRWRRP